MPFTPAAGIPVELLPDGRLRVTSPVVWTGTRGDAVTIPAGTVSDGASRPWWTGGVVDEWGPITRAAFVHDVLCDAANAWSRAGCPEESRPRFLGADIDGALRAAARDLGAATGERWLYWVAVRWAALFGSAGRRHAWTSTLWQVLALTVPALLVALPGVAGALLSRLVLIVCDLVAWPWTRSAPRLFGPGRRPLAHAFESPRQTTPGRAQLWHAAQTHGLTAENAARTVVLPPPVGPTSGPQAVVNARRVAARQRDEEPAPWCARYLQPCLTGCDPARQCDRLCLAGCAPDGSIHMPTCPNLPEETTR